MSSEASSLVRDLLRPEAYGRDPAAIVTLRTTHPSWVLLVGDFFGKADQRPLFGRERLHRVQ